MKRLAGRPRAAIPTELLVNLTLRELRGRYKRSVLGWGWSIINPVFNLIIYTVVFSLFLRVEPPVGDPSGLHNYSLFLMSGLLPWLFLTNSMGGGSGVLVANEGLITKVYFARWTLPASVVLASLSSLTVELAVLSVALLIAGSMVLPWLPVVMAIMALQAAFILGLTLTASICNAYLRDVNHFVAIFLNAWFYATPILYPLDAIPDWAQQLQRLNPMFHFIDAYRSTMYDLRFPELRDWAAMLLIAVASMVIGRFTFRRLEPRLAEEL
ncbi:ABC transporter permease [Actinospongicola halichondriae]|uniref:ABC transporter permease n=1 Tax=Actinospongicola halichondriae TaxID=3236844 RepID=UPI003D3DB0B9